MKATASERNTWTMHRPEAAQAVELFRRYFLNRLDVLCFAPPWKANVCPIQAGEDLDAILLAHVLGEFAPVVKVRWMKGGKVEGTEIGRFRVGSYSPAPGTSLTCCACVDCDGGGHHGHALADPTSVALAILGRLEALGVSAYLECSGSAAGWHVWVFFDTPVAAALARELLYAVVPADAPLLAGGFADAHSGTGLEVFPKQDAIEEDGYGNQVWLPWWHGAKDGGNLFHELDQAGQLVPYAPDNFLTVSPGALADVLNRLRSKKNGEEQPKKKTTRRGMRTKATGGRPSSETLLHWALDRCVPGKSQGRNRTGFDLACQLRDNGYTQAEAESVLKDYAKQAPKVEGDPYTESEALASLGQAYKKPARKPWESNGVHRTDSSGGKGRPDDGAPGDEPDNGDEAEEHQEERRPSGLTNVLVRKIQKGKETITVRDPLSPAEIKKQLDRITPGWPKCVGGRLLAIEEGYLPLWLDTADSLFAWITRQLPPSATNPIHWATQGRDLVTAARFAAFLKQAAEQYDALAQYPHWPQLPKTYYLHPPLQGGDGKALSTLLARFSPATDCDQSLMLAFLLTLVWGGAPGRRPAFLATRDMQSQDNGRGVGKSAYFHVTAGMVGGQAEFDTSARRDEIATRLLSEAGQGIRAAMLDNIKTLRFSWAELEGLITSPVISGHQMYHGEGRRPNHLVWCLTLNGAGLSKDIAQRVIPIWLKRPAYSATWREEAEGFIEENRWAILGDLVQLLKSKPAQDLEKFSRWGDWERDVLSRVDRAEDCKKLIADRQGSMDADADEADLVRDYFADRLKDRGHCSDTDVVRISSAIAAEWLALATDEKRPVNKSSVYLAGLAIPELQKSNRGEGRGWVWRGTESPIAADSVPLKGAEAQAQTVGQPGRTEGEPPPGW